LGYCPIYPKESGIMAMIKLTGDDISEDLLEVSCKNADSTINGRLLMHSLPTYDNESEDVPSMLETCGNYLAVSDIHQALDGTDDRASNEEAYYDKAMILLDAYIKEQEDKLALTELKEKSPYAHSQSKSLKELHIPY
ncbi:hypothetical protein, partial [Methanobrevibacter sp.]|uniref:hypothetical protein n=1 Tax=Methanobrevibacter sp. TaxID=66852 RepID=UPI00388EEEB3